MLMIDLAQEYRQSAAMLEPAIEAALRRAEAPGACWADWKEYRELCKMRLRCIRTAEYLEGYYGSKYKHQETGRRGGGVAPAPDTGRTDTESTSAQNDGKTALCSAAVLAGWM